MDIANVEGQASGRRAARSKGVAALLAWVAAVAIAQTSAAAATPNEQRLSHGRFHDFAVYSPTSVPRTVVLLLSDVHGWNRSASTIAQQLARGGALVVGVDLPK